MLTYSYTARDASTGEKVKSQIQADSEQAASRLIRQQGLVPLDVSLTAGSGGGALGVFNHVKTKDRILFSRQIATLINAGLPLVQSLRSVGAQTASKPFKVIISQIIADVEAGSSLSVSLGRHPDVFNQVYVSMIAAGEASGTLDASFERLATQQEKDADIIAKVRGAMVYPLIVLVIMGVVVGFMLVKVLPQVQVMYDAMPGAELPLITTVLLFVSHAIIKFWWVFAILAGLGVFFSMRWARTIAGKRLFDKVKMKAWPTGPLFMKMYMARFARTAATLVSSGVPLIQVLEITADAINNVHISDSIIKAIDKVKSGKPLSEALNGDPNFLSLVPDMLRIGEQSGAIEKMLSKTADYYEKEVDNQIKAISTIIEPLLMVVLGIVAFIIVAAVLLPIYSLAGKTMM